MNVEVRRLQPGDEQVALEVVRAVMPVDERDGREPTIGHLQRMLGQDSNYVIAAITNSGTEGAPVGFLTAYRMPALGCDASMVYIFEIEVIPSYRRRGIGKRMIELLKTICLESDVEDIWVGTENDNIAAKRLYESTRGVLADADQCEYIYDLTTT